MNNQKLIEQAEKVIVILQSGWCKGFVARNENGDGVAVNSKDAVSFCWAGALGLVCDVPCAEVHRFSLYNQFRLDLPGPLGDFNDNALSVEEVIAQIQVTIDRLKKENS